MIPNTEAEAETEIATLRARVAALEARLEIQAVQAAPTEAPLAPIGTIDALSEIVDNLPQCVSVWDLETNKLVYVNPAYTEIWGRPVALLFENRSAWLDGIPVDERAGVWAALAAAARGGPCEANYRFLRADGAKRIARTRFLPLRDQTGQVTRIAGITSDITVEHDAERVLLGARATLERQVAERTAELSDLYNQAPCGYHATDERGTIVQINDTELRWLGYRREQIIGRKTIFELVGPESKQAMLGLRGRLERRELEAMEGFEAVLLRADGSRLIGLFNVVGLYDASGALQRVRATLTDVTSRKRAEEALREREGLLQDFLDNSSDLVLSVTLDGRCSYTNRSWRETLGYTQEEAGRLSVFTLLAPDDQARWQEAVSTVIHERRAVQIELTFLAKEGAAIFVEGAMSPRIQNGHTVALGGMFRDVSARRKADAAVLQSRDTLQYANEALLRASAMKDEFLAGMSHELRTPLNAVLGLCEGLQEGAYGPVDAKQLRALGRIEESGRHLLSLINDVLDLSKLEAQKMELDVSTVSVRGICEASVRMVKEAAHTKQISLTVRVAEACYAVPADERKLKQILVNLLSNAVKFTPPGGSIGVDVELVGTEGDVCFTVWDTGAGIADDQVSRLFQPFVQLDGKLARQHGGTGLGLALVRRLVELHGGGITLDSTPGRGSRFSVVLHGATSRGEIEGLPPPSTSRLPRRLTVAPKSNSVRVLIADDDDNNVMMLGDFLRARGHDVFVARDGREAVLLARELRPDVILMDVQMPVLDGLGATRELRTDPDEQVRAVPIVIVTALAMLGDRERCLAAGADDYVTKPVPLKQLAALIQRVSAVRAASL